MTMMTMIMMTMIMSSRLVIKTPFLKLLQFKNPQTSLGGSFKISSLIFISIVFISCTSNTDQGVLSLEDTPVEVDTQNELADISPEDAQLIIAACLREKGFQVQDPSSGQGLREQIGPQNQEERQEIFETVRLCAEENNLPLFSESAFEDPELVAAQLDDQLKIAQCLREEKGFEVQDPTAETGLRELVRHLVSSGIYDPQEVRIAIDSCFDELGIERPDVPGGGPRG